MDFRVFPEVKSQLRGIRFASKQELTVAAKRIVSSFDADWLLRNTVLREGRTLRQSGIFIREELTPLNLEVYMSVKRKMTDEVSSVWTRNGAIFYKNVQEQVTRVDFEDYQTCERKIKGLCRSFSTIEINYCIVQV
ncbi:hypothetical protein DPMN_084532 [Dreissena polymorpha]|uniref:Uncharacterized protein n=1 Tax=Dreissena polymorpha TaxID=45954 RepID=A0A9D3YBZ1_DREPO|nr:hypothetical protein DPMN_084532 [Dreissena polymorpha]